MRPRESSRQRTVLIAGGGVAGLTLANDLASRGIQFRVIDPLPEAVRDSRAHGMLGRTLMALDKLGLAEPMLAASKQPPPIVREYFGNKLVAQTDFATVPRDPYPVSLPIFQQRVARVLETALAARGHRVEWSTELKAVEIDENGVLATVDRAGKIDTLAAGWIVGCDGSHSIVRKTLTPEFPGETLGLQGLICECDIDWTRSRDIWWTWQSRDGLVGAIYNDFIEKWHVLVLDVERRPTQSDSSNLERMEFLLRQMSGENHVRLSNPNWVRADASFSQRIAEHFIAKRAILAGDAAHLFSSAAGHGVHCAIEDALNLGWKLGLTLSGLASPSLLQTYEAERRGHADEVIRKTRWVQRFLRLRGGPRKILWGLLYIVGKHLRSISAIFNKQIDRLATEYRSSPLSCQDSSQMTPSTCAGMRAPDAACRIGGRQSHLLEIIRGPQADLLLFSGLSPAPETVRALRVIEESVVALREHLRVRYVFPSQAYANNAGMGEHDPNVIVDGLEKLHTAFGILKPEIVYLRPDGYIGLRTQNLQEKTLFEYLRIIYAADLL